MASRAYNLYMIPLLEDAEELDAAHSELRTGTPGRQWRLGALNRASVVMCLSAWEAFCEELVLDALKAIQPPGPPHVGLWQSINADARSKIGRFNTPNPDNVARLIADTIGLQAVDDSWSWQNSTPQQARDRLNAAIKYRHEIAHGVNPRPTIHNTYSSRLPGFFRSLGRCTDAAVRGYLAGPLAVPNPWPP